MTIKILDKALHILKNENEEVEKKDIPAQFDKFICDVVEFINTNKNVRLYQVRDYNLQVVETVLNIANSYIENAEVSNEEYDKNAKKLIKEENIAQRRIERLNKTIKKGSLIQAMLLNEEDGHYAFLIAKIENKIFYDENTLDIHSGIDGENNKLWKSCLFKFEKNEDNKLDITEIKIYSDNGAKYWWDTFLEVEPISNDEKNTKKAFDSVDKLLASELKKISEQDYFTLRNSLIGHFRNKDFFDYQEMINSVFANYEPEKINKEIYDETLRKMKDLPEIKGFDSQFSVVKKIVTNKIKRVYNINTGIQLNVVDYIENLKDTIKSYEEDGQKYLKIKIKETDEKNNELYETFL